MISSSYQDVFWLTKRPNMVLQQCLACNIVMTEPCRSCVCGHVFEDAKQIGGKRFSEYRAKLYSRLESKRMKQIARENRKPKEMGARQQPAESKVTFQINLAGSNEITRPSFKPKTHPVSKNFHRQRKDKRLPRPVTHLSLNKTVLPPELVSRLPGALKEINRRLTGQNVGWWARQFVG